MSFRPLLGKSLFSFVRPHSTQPTAHHQPPAPMPLVIVCGYPCSGKTTFARQLADHLLAHGVGKVKVVNEESECLGKRAGYQDAASEKKTRGALKSAVDHHLDADCVVVLDSMNYIKGYRYELFCLAKTLRTPHCCVWVECDDAVGQRWNTERGDAGYDDAVLVELRRRFEAPNAKNRWDSPLFRVNMTPPGATATAAADAAPAPQTVFAKTEAAAATSSSSSFKSSFRRAAGASSTGGGDDTRSVVTTSAASAADTDTAATAGALSFSGFVRALPTTAAAAALPAADAFPLIHRHLTSTASAPPNSSTVAVPRVQADLLHECDRVSQGMCQRIIAHQTGPPLPNLPHPRTLTSPYRPPHPSPQRTSRARRCSSPSTTAPSPSTATWGWPSSSGTGGSSSRPAPTCRRPRSKTPAPRSWTSSPSTSDRWVANSTYVTFMCFLRDTGVRSCAKLRTIKEKRN